MKIENKLLPCPFCGGEAFDCKDGTVYCVKCECIMKSHKAWNTRPKLSEEKVAEILCWEANELLEVQPTERYYKETAKAICNTNLWEG